MHIPGLWAAVCHVPVHHRARSDPYHHSHIGRILLAVLAVGVGTAVVHRGAVARLHRLRTGGVRADSGRNASMSTIWKSKDKILKFVQMWNI